MVLSWHNDPDVKAFHVARARYHRKADMLLAGTYNNYDKSNFRGCSIGCIAHDIDPDRTDYHAVVAEHAGWPEWLAHLNDSIFEGLPRGERESFHVELREAIPVGVNLMPVYHRLASRRIDRLLPGQVGEVLEAMQAVRSAHEEAIRGIPVDWERVQEMAAAAARAAARDAAWSASRAAESTAQAAESAESAESAEAAAESAKWARGAEWAKVQEMAESASRAAARDAAWAAESEEMAEAVARAAESTAREAAWRTEAADLLELLREAT